jgi:hypothetical protein
MRVHVFRHLLQVVNATDKSTASPQIPDDQPSSQAQGYDGFQFGTHIRVLCFNMHLH